MGKHFLHELVRPFIPEDPACGRWHVGSSGKPGPGGHSRQQLTPGQEAGIKGLRELEEGQRALCPHCFERAAVSPSGKERLLSARGEAHLPIREEALTHGPPRCLPRGAGVTVQASVTGTPPPSPLAFGWVLC